MVHRASVSRTPGAGLGLLERELLGHDVDKDPRPLGDALALQKKRHCRSENRNGDEQAQTLAICESIYSLLLSEIEIDHSVHDEVA